jgi:hypothetical protein
MIVGCVKPDCVKSGETEAASAPVDVNASHPAPPNATQKLEVFMGGSLSRIDMIHVKETT